MDVSDCRAIVERHLPALRDFFCLGHWSITPKFEHLDGTTAAQCWPEVDYEHANILFDAAKFETEEQVIDLIVHELAHIISSPFDLILDLALRADGDGQSAMMRRVYTHATEHHVIHIERIWRKTLARVYLDQTTRPESD